MNKSFIKNYALTLTPETIKSFALKDGTLVSDEEAELFVKILHERIDEMLDGHALDVLEENKGKISSSSYNKLLELYNKYKKFIG